MRQASWSNMVTPHMFFSVSGGGEKVRSESGWVGAEKSSGIAPVGAGTSLTGMIGSPVRRSST